MPNHAKGFSLVEMMVVLFVMGLLASIAVLSMPGDEATLRREAERFAARANAGRDEAITGARPVALVVGTAGYYFERREGGAWAPLPGMDLTGWTAGTQVAVLGTGNGATVERSRIVFDTLGLAASDTAVRLSRRERWMTVRIARDGRVRLDAG